MEQSIVIENKKMRLEIGCDGTARSLVCKETGEECLDTKDKTAVFTVTQNRPYNNEIKLMHPNKKMVCNANSVRREGDLLFVKFETVPVEAVIEIAVAENYIAFTAAEFIVHPGDYDGMRMVKPPVEELRILQLPVRDRGYFGDWLNISRGEKTDVCVISTSQYARIDAERRTGYRLMTADAVRTIRLKGTGAALIADTHENILDDIDAIEKAYGLPRGVESRRSRYINRSIYWTNDICPDNCVEHIRRAKEGGFKLMLIFYNAIFKSSGGYETCGNYDFLDYKDSYPDGIGSLKQMLNDIHTAGIIPGFHFLHTHIGVKSRYAMPYADCRLNKKAKYTLARALEMTDEVIYVDENPELAETVDSCHVFQIGSEMIGYEKYTTEPPYRFMKCTRGMFGTYRCEHMQGLAGGIADLSEYGAESIYIDQNSTLQDEIGGKLARLYDCGFEFAYFDGSEGTNAPHEFHVPNAQYRVFRQFRSEPIFAEAAARAHFSWHMISGGNAFDIFPPEVFKEKLREFPCSQAPRMREEFTRINFGWWAYWVPGVQLDRPTLSMIGTQPDMYEYGTSRAAAWDCPATVMGDLKAFKAHPRTKDILEVMRRWEDVRAIGWLTSEQKEQLRDLSREHILLVNEKGEYELMPYEQVEGACGGNEKIRAFVFEREGASCAVYWHTSGSGRLALPIAAENIEVTDEIGDTPITLESRENAVVVPADGRRYIKTNLTREELVNALTAGTLEA